jgi:hypothetical protein
MRIARVLTGSYWLAPVGGWASRLRDYHGYLACFASIRNAERREAENGVILRVSREWAYVAQSGFLEDILEIDGL